MSEDEDRKFLENTRMLEKVDCRTCMMFTEKGRCGSIAECSYRFPMYHPKAAIQLFQKTERFNWGK